MASVRVTVHLHTMRMVNLPAGYTPTSTWTKKSTGIYQFYGDCVWTDGSNIYYSYNSMQYVLNGDTWEKKTWYGLTSFMGNRIWSYNGVVYYSNGSSGQYYLSGDTWLSKTWEGLNQPLMSFRVWTHGGNVYYSYDKNCQYVLTGSKWEPMEWGGNSDFSGEGINTDGVNIYNGNGDMLVGTTWVPAGASYRYGQNVWTDGVGVYYSYNYTTYVLNGAGGTKTWDGASVNSGDRVWTDGRNIYYGNGTSQYILEATIEEPEPEITGITIEPTEVSLPRGETCQFTATVEGDEGCSQEVVFSLSGNDGTSETTISETGLLEVGADETSETFEVIVYPVDNPDITASALVTIVVPDLKPTYRMESGNWVKKTAYQRIEGEWVLISTAKATT